MTPQDDHDGATALVATERDALLRRCLGDSRRTPETIRWAAQRLLAGPEGARGMSPRDVRSELERLSAQRHALDTAYAQLLPASFVPGRTVCARADAGNQAYLELLGGLQAHPGWCRDATIARMQLLVRVRRRMLDAGRAAAWLSSLEHVEDREPARADSGGDRGLRDLYAVLRRGLGAADAPKLDRFVAHAILDVPHDALVHQTGMSSAALRKERSRLAPRIAELLDVS